MRLLMRGRHLRALISASQRRWLLLNAVVVTAFINLVVNAAIAWLSSHGRNSVPILSQPLQEPSTVTDTLGTLFLLPFMTSVICSAFVHRDLRRGALDPLPVSDALPWVARWRLAGPAVRGARLGGASILLLGPLATAVIALVHFGDITAGGFVLYKAIFGVVFGLVVTPLIALIAMADDTR